MSRSNLIQLCMIGVIIVQFSWYLDGQFEGIEERIEGISEMSRETMDNELRQRVIKTLDWMVKDAKFRFDDCKQNLEEGSEGGYSPELQEAIGLLDELKKRE